MRRREAERRAARIAAAAVVAWGAVAAVPGPAGARAPAGGNRPNVVVLLVDALRADHLGCYGYGRNTSPVLDGLAETGVVFETAMSQASWTKPSIPSLFTGLYPIEHRVFTGSKKDTADRITSDVLDADLRTLAEAFRDAGYATAAFVHNAQIRSFLGFDQGFDVYAEGLGDAGRVTGAFLDWLGADSAPPFFAYVHYLDPHWPYTPPPAYEEKFPAPPGPLDFDHVHWKFLERQIERGEVELTPADLEAMRARYDGEILFTDAMVGRLLEGLRKRGLDGNTVVVVTADHGEEFGEHGGIGHGNSLHDELLHVPLIFRVPGERAGRVRELVRVVDILPTVLDLAGVPVPAGVSGRSLRPAIEGKPLDPAPAFADHRPGGRVGRILQCVRSGRHKLIRTFEVEGEEEASASPWGLPAIVPGQWLEVDGVMQPGRRFVAMDIERIPDPGGTKIEGPVEGIGPRPGDFRLLGYSCRLVPGVKFKDGSGQRIRDVEIREEMWIQAKGGLAAGGIFEVRRVKLLDGPETEAEIKARVEEVYPAGDGWILEMAGVRVEIDEDTDFEGDWPDAEPAPPASPPVPFPRESSGERPAARVLLGFELYDLAEDPGEQRDLAGSRPELVRRLDAMLDDWEARHVPARDPGERVVLDEETLKQLRALGYVD